MGASRARGRVALDSPGVGRTSWASMEREIQTRFVRRAAVAERQVGDERLLVPVRTSVAAKVEVLALNETAAVIWDALASPSPVETLVHAVCESFEID